MNLSPTGGAIEERSVAAPSGNLALLLELREIVRQLPELMRRVQEEADQIYAGLEGILCGPALLHHRRAWSDRKRALDETLAPLQIYSRESLPELAGDLHQAPKIFSAFCYAADCVRQGHFPPESARNILFAGNLYEAFPVHEFFDGGRWDRPVLNAWLDSSFQAVKRTAPLGTLLQWLSGQGRVELLMPTSALARVRVPEALVKSAVLQFVDNAIEEQDPACLRPVKIGCGREAEQLVISVHDEGPGLSAIVIDRFGYPQASSKEQGTGNGLLSNLKIIEHYGGEVTVVTRRREDGVVCSFSYAGGCRSPVTVRDDPGWRGTCITIRLPLQGWDEAMTPYRAAFSSMWISGLP